jgi:hypothetical protein
VSYDLAVFASDRPDVPVAEDVEIDGPLEAEDEDAPAPVVAALLSVRWTVELSGSEPKAVTRLARAVAESARGVVYDPQEDRIVWPRNPAKLRKVETSRDPTRPRTARSARSRRAARCATRRRQGHRPAHGEARVPQAQMSCGRDGVRPGALNPAHRPMASDSTRSVSVARWLARSSPLCSATSSRVGSARSAS